MLSTSDEAVKLMIERFIDHFRILLNNTGHL